MKVWNYSGMTESHYNLQAVPVLWKHTPNLQSLKLPVSLPSALTVTHSSLMWSLEHRHRRETQIFKLQLILGNLTHQCAVTMATILDTIILGWRQLAFIPKGKLQWRGRGDTKSEIWEPMSNQCQPMSIVWKYILSFKSGSHVKSSEILLLGNMFYFQSFCF